MIIKIDLEKAYDRLEWSSILETLRDIGHLDKMVDVIFKCLSCGTFSFLWNGVKTDKIRPN